MPAVRADDEEAAILHDAGLGQIDLLWMDEAGAFDGAMEILTTDGMPLEAK